MNRLPKTLKIGGASVSSNNAQLSGDMSKETTDSMKSAEADMSPALVELGNRTRVVVI